MNESFFDLSLNSTTYSNSGSSGWGNLVDDSNYSDEFENYNSRIMIGNSSGVVSEPFADISLEVDSIAVGNNMAVVSASDGKLYLIK